MCAAAAYHTRQQNAEHITQKHRVCVSCDWGPVWGEKSLPEPCCAIDRTIGGEEEWSVESGGGDVGERYNEETGATS